MLKGLNWLNDEIINFYMAMIVERASGDPVCSVLFPSVHAFNTQFYPEIAQKAFIRFLQQSPPLQSGCPLEMR